MGKIASRGGMARFRPFIDRSPADRTAAASAPLLVDASPSLSDAETLDADELSPTMSDHPPKMVERPTTARVHDRRWLRVVQQLRLAEFALSAAMMGGALVFAIIDVHEREIPYIKVKVANETYYALDPNINRTKLAEQVPMMALVIVGAVVPIATNLVMNYVLPRFTRVTVERHDTRDFLLSLLQSVSLAQILTQFIKNQTGRFRPSFYDMCGWQFDVEWNGETNLCTDSTHEQEARKSFPSGHSSYAWSTMLVLTLYLLGRARLNALNRGESIARGSRKSFKLFLCFAPLLAASWVAITRSVDNWHHYSDILAGSIIGAVSACVGYFHNYGSVFSRDTAGSTLEDISRRHRHGKKKLLESSSSSGTVGSQEELLHSRVTNEYALSYTARSRPEPSIGILV